MDWSDRISSLMRETQMNLERVSSQPSRQLPKFFSEDRHLFSEQSQSIHDTDIYEGDPNNPLPRFSQRGPQDLPLPTVPSTYLLDRISHYEKALEEMGSKMKLMENKIHDQNTVISKLQDEVTLLNKRLQEKGVDLLTERKMEQWKYEFSTKMQDMESFMNAKKMEERQNSLSVSTVNRLGHELRSLRQNYQQEIDLLERDISNLKSSLLSVNSDHVALSSDVKMLGLGQKSLQRDFESVSTQLMGQQKRGGANVTTSMSPLDEEIFEEFLLKTQIIAKIRQETRELKLQMADIKDQLGVDGPFHHDRRKDSPQNHRRRRNKKNETLDSTLGLTEDSFSSGDDEFLGRDPTSLLLDEEELQLSLLHRQGSHSLLDDNDDSEF